MPNANSLRNRMAQTRMVMLLLDRLLWRLPLLRALRLLAQRLAHVKVRHALEHIVRPPLATTDGSRQLRADSGYAVVCCAVVVTIRYRAVAVPRALRRALEVELFHAFPTRGLTAVRALRAGQAAGAAFGAFLPEGRAA